MAIATMLVISLSAPAVAGDQRASLAMAAERAAQREPAPNTEAPVRSEQVAQPAGGRMPRGYLWAGTAMFVGGMAVGLYAFHNNRNGEYPEFGENEATNQWLGAAGLFTAFAGGTVLYLGHRRARGLPSLTFGPTQVKVTKQLSW
jgi:hypothetical protein